MTQDLEKNTTSDIHSRKNDSFRNDILKDLDTSQDIRYSSKIVGKSEHESPLKCSIEQNEKIQDQRKIDSLSNSNSISQKTPTDDETVYVTCMNMDSLTNSIPSRYTVLNSNSGTQYYTQHQFSEKFGQSRFNTYSDY
jgi:hypothetical protein